MSTKKKSIWKNLKPVANSANAIVYEVVAPTHAELRAQPTKERYKEMQGRARRYARKLMLEVEDALAPGFSWAEIFPTFVYYTIRMTKEAQYLTYPPALGFKRKTVKNEVLIALEKRIGYRRLAEPWGIKLAEAYLSGYGWDKEDDLYIDGCYLNTFISETARSDKKLGAIIKNNVTLHSEIYNETYRHLCNLAYLAKKSRK